MYSLSNIRVFLITIGDVYCIANNFINDNEMCFILKIDGRKK